MNYKHSCVIDAEGYYKTLVLVLLESDENGQEQENIQYYTLQEGETLLDTDFPADMLKARWNGTEWEETATLEELEQWRQSKQMWWVSGWR